MTEWRTHPTLEHVEVSDDGHVRTTDREVPAAHGSIRLHRGRELSQHLGTSGYLTVLGRKRVHVLVCETFHGLKANAALEVRHLNGDKHDNRASNLLWGTRSENTLDTVRHGNNKQAAKTHCKYGHEFTSDNTVRGGRDTRACRKCREFRTKNRYYDENGKRTTRGLIPT